MKAYTITPKGQVTIPAEIREKMVQAAKDGSLLLVTDLIVICEMIWVFGHYYLI